MQSNQQNSAKVPMIIAAVVLLGAAFYYFYYQGDAVATDAQSSLAVSSTPTNEQTGANVLQLLNQIRALKIDTKFFETPVYQSLIDFSVEIPTVNVGRPNPFSNVGSFVTTTPAPAPTVSNAAATIHTTGSGSTGGGR